MANQIAGARFNQRFELQTFLPALELVRNGVCRCVCDPITAISYAQHAPGGSDVSFLRFEPRIDFSVAILLPAHRPASLLALAFRDVLAGVLRQLGNV